MQEAFVPSPEEKEVDCADLGPERQAVPPVGQGGGRCPLRRVRAEIHPRHHLPRFFSRQASGPLRPSVMTDFWRIMAA